MRQVAQTEHGELLKAISSLLLEQALSGPTVESTSLANGPGCVRDILACVYY